MLFTENESNCRRLWGQPNASPYVKDACHEYFQGDNGAGLGASHQTGWTGTVARLLDLFGRIGAKDLEMDLGQVSARLVRKQVGGELTTAT